MTTNEGARIYALIVQSYPVHFKNIQKEDIERMGAIYAGVIMGTYEEGMKGLQAYMALERTGFPPSAGQINQYIGEPTIAESDAWDLVTKATRNGTYGAEKEFAALPPLVQAAIGSPSVLAEWSKTDASIIQSTIRANFRRSFEAAIKRAQESEILPNREAIQAYEPPQIEQKEEPEPEYRDRTKDIEDLKKRLGLG